MSRVEKFNESTRKLRDQLALEYGQDINDPNFVEGFHEFEKKVYEARIAKYTKALLGKYPLKLVQKVFDRAVKIYSPSEIEEMPFEEIMVEVIGTDPEGVSAEDVGIFFNKKTGQLKNWIPDPYDTDLRWPDAEALERGEVREVEVPIKSKPQAPDMPSEVKLKTMPLGELGKLINQAGKAVSEE